MTVGSLILSPGMEPPAAPAPKRSSCWSPKAQELSPWKTRFYEVGPGSMMYCAGNKMHGIRNTGTVPMTFYFHKWLA
jgi:hypothetical protein